MRECPNCYEKWASKEARISSFRLWHGSVLTVRKRGWFRVDDYDPRINHVMISIPDIGQGLVKSRRNAIEIAKRHGFAGGLTIYHPFRQEHERGPFVKDGFHHFHMVALAPESWTPGGTDFTPDGQTIVFKVIQDAVCLDLRGYRNQEGVRRSVLYLLSYCGVVKGHHSLTWCGVLSYNQMRNPDFQKAYPDDWAEVSRIRNPRCPKCGSEDTELLFTTQDFGWRSTEPIHHSLSYGVPWGG